MNIPRLSDISAPGASVSMEVLQDVSLHALRKIYLAYQISALAEMLFGFGVAFVLVGYQASSRFSGMCTE
jgi:hypothetical protein